MENTQQARELMVDIKDFSGPLEFLYQLIIERKKNILDINILDISLAYVEYIRKNIMTMNIDEITDGLSMMTHMIELKSKKLLPIHENDKNIDTEIERDKFIQRVLMYKKFKDIIPHLEEKFQERSKMLVRNSESHDEFEEDKIIEELPEFVSPNKLLNAMKNVYKEMMDHQKFTNIMNIEIKELSIEGITNQMLDIIRINEGNNKITLDLLLRSIPIEQISKQYFAVSFVAILVLTRNGLISLSQNTDIDEHIYIEIIDLELSFELEEEPKSKKKENVKEEINE